MPVKRRHGIYVASKNLFYHSTLAAGINHTSVLASIDIPLSADNYMFDASPTSNNSTDTAFDIGELNISAEIARGWIKPDFSLLSGGEIFSSAILKMTPVADRSSNARTMRAHRCLRATVDDQQTWNVYSTGNNWSSGGASSSGNDYDSTEMGNGLIPASPTLNVQMTAITFLASEFQKLYDGTYVNNGIILFMDTQLNDDTSWASRENATPAYRPVITIEYWN